jgi:hypothetical protein
MYIKINYLKIKIMEEQGILTLEQEKKIASLLDDLLKLKGFLELVDGYVFKAILTFIDNKYVDKLSVDIKTKLAALVEAVMAENVELAETLTTDLMNTLIDIPGLDEESEGLLFKGVIELVVGAILDWINSKKPAPVTLKLNR